MIEAPNPGFGIHEPVQQDYVSQRFGMEVNMSSIKDVARRAGVAISTVSKALNGYPNVSEETREKVNEAVRELNFTPNPIASALSSKKAGRVALLIKLNT